MWLHAEVGARGGASVLLEHRALGSGQTVASQGIIHGGVKYTLTGALTRSAEHLAPMPAKWRACLGGRDQPDLRGAALLSTHQYLCAAETFGSRFAAFAASRVMRSRLEAVTEADEPAFRRAHGFEGRVYRLDEPVLDARAVLARLAAGASGPILQIDEHDGLAVRPNANTGATRVVARHESAGEIEFDAARVVWTAGRGNEDAARFLPSKTIATQRRPLHMVMARTVTETPMYAHFLGAGALPKATITTHTDRAGRTVLYIGGRIAEEGVRFDSAELVRRTAAALRELLPAFDPAAHEWATLRVDRAEPRQPGRTRPDTAVFIEHGNTIVAWPAKLALAPHLAQRIRARLEPFTTRGGENDRPDACSAANANRNAYADPDMDMDMDMDGNGNADSDTEANAKTQAKPIEQHLTNPGGWSESLAHWPRPPIAPAPWDEEEREWTSAC